jgi:hypothetical protein
MPARPARVGFPLTKKRQSERRKVKDRRVVSRGGRRTTDPNAEEREFRIAEQLEFLRRQHRKSSRSR